MMTKTHSFSGSRQITFKSDGFTLTGTLHLPESHNPPIVIGCHGLLSNSDSPKQIALAKHCDAAGLAFFRFNHRGCGDSEGNLEKDTSFQARCRDLGFALRKIHSLDFVGDRIGLFGSSLGGSVCLDIAGSHSIQAIVTFAAPLHSRLPGKLTALPNLAFNLSGGLSGIKNIHIFHGDADDTVPLSQARSIYRQVAEPKKLTIQENGDHRMSGRSHQNTFLEIAVQWFSKYLQ
ncbi:MAG: damage-inducible protein CinA [Deltaproteobacteria bacterium]|nr:MAG: damage-inducible protein CinA [Deltaproteobacteria bacterium]